MKKVKNILVFVFSLLFIISITGNIYAVSEANFDLESNSAILLDATSGKVLYEKDADKKMPPASITKIMTMLLVMEALDEGRVGWDDTIVATEHAAQMGGSQIWLEAGEEMRLKDILKAIAIVSANDACVAVAEHIYGTHDAFVTAMNEKAKELGMENSYFYNTNGLPSTDPEIEGNHTTARDIAIMSRELLKYSEILEFTSTWIDHIRGEESFLRNTNNLVRFYQGADGLKTGYTQEAGFCLSATASKDGMRFIAVVMDAPNSQIRFNEARNLLNYAFSIHHSVSIVDKGTEVDKVKIFKGEVEEIKAIAKDDLKITLLRGEEKELIKQTRLNKEVVAPVKAGDKVGVIVALKEDKEVGRVDLVAKEDVEKANFFMIIIQILKRFITNLMNVF